MNYISPTERQKTRNQLNIPTLVTVKDGMYILQVREGQVYDFEVNRCRNAKRLAGWLLHLSEKVWFTQEHARQFMEAFEYLFPKEVDRHG